MLIMNSDQNLYTARKEQLTQSMLQLPSIIALPHHEPFHETPEQRWQLVM
jgi:hypothetical protein